jgi:hypothetical protein
MPIDINSLFADIIDTPEQRQQKLLQQGMMQGQLLASGLRGRAAALAPLAQVAGQLGVQRNENLRRAVQPMLGIDPRTTGEKMAEEIGRIDLTTPNGLLEAANKLQSTDPIRAAALRQEAISLTQSIADRNRTIRRQDEADERARSAESRAQKAETRADALHILNTQRLEEQLLDAATTREDSEEEQARLNNQRTLVVNTVRKTNPEYANIIEQGNFTSNQLTSIYEKFTEDPEIKTTIASIKGSDVLRLNPDLNIESPNASYQVMIRTNEGRNPETNPSDRIGAIVSFVGQNQGTAAGAIPRLEQTEYKNLALENFGQYIEAGASKEAIAQAIYDEVTINDVDRETAIETVLNNYRLNKPRAAVINNDALANPSIVHPLLTKEFFKAKQISKNDELKFEPITQAQIDSGEFEGSGFTPSVGDLIMLYPNRLPNKQLDKDPETRQIRYNRIYLPR